jgi:hypothetical protein
MNSELLAFRKYPQGEGTSYFASDLDTQEKIIKLFDYCQILEAIVTKEGWLFLLSKFGKEKLYEYNNLSGWMDCESINEFEQEIIEQIKSA